MTILNDPHLESLLDRLHKRSEAQASARRQTQLATWAMHTARLAQSLEPRSSMIGTYCSRAKSAIAKVRREHSSTPLLSSVNWGQKRSRIQSVRRARNL